MKRLQTVAAIAASLLLTGMAHAETVGEKQAAFVLNGTSQGTEPGRMLAAKMAYYHRSCPVATTKVQANMMSETVMQNGGMQSAWRYGKEMDGILKTIGKDKWCTAYKGILDKAEEMLSPAVKAELSK